MREARWAREDEGKDIVEFLDYVFSKAHRPHDFASLLPKVYERPAAGAAHHFIVREEGRLVAAVLCWPVCMHMGGERLTGLAIGSVSTHPAVRGQGYMACLMDAADRRAKELGADFAVLSGLRQRYERFGYVFGGYQMNARLTAHNVRHALEDVSTQGWSLAPMEQAHVREALALHERQPCFCARGEKTYLNDLRSWSNQPFVLMKDGQSAGFGALRRNPESSHVAELLLESEADFAPAMKALFEAHGTLTISAAPWERARAAWLSRVCQDVSIGKNHAFKLYRPERVRAACRAMGCEGEGAAFDGFALPLPLYIGPADCV